MTLFLDYIFLSSFAFTIAAGFFLAFKVIKLI